MTREQFIQYSMQKRSLRPVVKNELPSVTDPTMAQSGRDLVFNPKPIIYNRCDYFKGVPAAEMHSFDKMYADKLDVFEDAKNHSSETKQKLDILQKEYEKSKKQTKENQSSSEGAQ